MGLGDATPIDKSPKPQPKPAPDPCIDEDTSAGGVEAAMTSAHIQHDVSHRDD